MVWSVLSLEHYSDYVLSFLLKLWWSYIAFHMKSKSLAWKAPSAPSDPPGRRQQTGGFGVRWARAEGGSMALRSTVAVDKLT